MHLRLEIPRDNPFGFAPGETWTRELGLRLRVFAQAFAPWAAPVNPQPDGARREVAGRPAPTAAVEPVGLAGATVALQRRRPTVLILARRRTPRAGSPTPNNVPSGVREK